MSDCLAFRFFSNSIFLSRIFGCSAVKVCVFASPHFLLCFTQWFDSRLTKTHADYVDGASKMCITYHELRGKRKVATRHAVHVTAVFPTDRKIALVFRRFVLSNRFTQNPNGNRRNTKIYAIHFVTFHTWNKFDSSVNSVCVCDSLRMRLSVANGTNENMVSMAVDFPISRHCSCCCFAADVVVVRYLFVLFSVGSWILFCIYV